MASAAGHAGNGDIEAAFDTLRHASAVAFGGVGTANIVPPQANAYFAIRAVGSAYLPRIQQLLDEAIAAGQVYAATLLSDIDPAAGRQAWERLAIQHDSFNLQGRSVFSESTLSHYAKEQLAAMGVHPATDPGRPLPTMSQAAPAGTTLRELLADGPVHPVRAVEIVTDVAAALDSIHGRGLVHGAVRPENIVVAAGDSVQLVESEPKHQPRDSVIDPDPDRDVDTWYYAAPERFSTERLEPSADIYALACVLYECLTGSRPFPGPTLERVVIGHVSEPPPRVSAIRPDLPSQFDRVVAKGMAKNPDDRHRAAGELARDARDGTIQDDPGRCVTTTSYPLVDAVGDVVLESLYFDPRILFVTTDDEQRFVASLFPHVDPRTAVYVSRQTRIGFSRGPHFDLYQSMVHPAYPFVAILNLVGSATVESAVLHPALASYYFKHHPVPTENAYIARRLVSSLALEHPAAQVERNAVEPSVGMIIPQQNGALPVVHYVWPPAPYGRESYGLFLKFIVPRPEAEALAAARDQGFAPWRPGTRWQDQSEIDAVPPGPRLD
ncbi:hypothetical protein MBOU_12480 [Mycobacterium bourgelatii]|uniref:non-specific serine/threonine protein kinase n=1 Tax=Mycobacterium bourgelatii TaxID=1273442 RepID=A0A7I9YKJ4_MYCBU|nr:hypothetical protein MBOU_12480 [Mycobacterium bourgelatii]